MFELDKRLVDASHALGELPLSIVLLSRDANFPWCILVPKRDQVSEIHHLNHSDQLQLLKESQLLCSAMMEVFKPDKLNIAALGNVVKQLHIHHVARFTKDLAWPGAIWGALPAQQYQHDDLVSRIAMIRKVLAESGMTWAH